jgi:hypothetical protein
MNPQPPDLAAASKKWTDGELFWIAKHGIRMTGMPAFGHDHSDEDLWKIVAFVRKLDDLSESQVAALRQGEEAHHREQGIAGHEENRHDHSHEATTEDRLSGRVDESKER